MGISADNCWKGVPPSLRDRLETIAVPGYTEMEKLNIAQRYLVPRQIEEHGLLPAQCRFDEDAIQTIIQEYTYEAGVRDLERHMAAVCRSIDAQIAQGILPELTVSASVERRRLGNYAG